MIVHVSGMYDCLKKGGYLLMRVHHKKSKAKWWRALERAHFNLHGNLVYEGIDPRRCTRPSTGGNSSCVSQWILARKGHLDPQSTSTRRFLSRQVRAQSQEGCAAGDQLALCRKANLP
jgi:hypothetical protein